MITLSLSEDSVSTHFDPLRNFGSGAKIEAIIYSNGSFQLFEEAFKISSLLRVALSEPPSVTQLSSSKSFVDARYYAEFLDRSSIISIMKSIFAFAPVAGLSGGVIGDGKLKFDVTPNRKWKLIEPRFSLSRGTSAEVLDLQPKDFDSDFLGFFNNSTHIVIRYQGKNVTAAAIAPWSSAFPVAIELNGKFIELRKIEVTARIG